MIVYILVFQIIVFLAWICSRVGMSISGKFMFEFDQIHHFEIGLLNIVFPMWDALGYRWLGLIFSCIFTLIAVDDVIQHYWMQKTNNDKFDSPLKRIFRPIWSIPWRLRK